MGTTASRIRWSPGACDPRGRQPGHGAQELSSAPLPVPGVRRRVAPGHECSGRSACQALAGGGVLGAHGAGCSSCGGGAHRPGAGRVLEEPPTPLSWVKASVY